MDDVFVSYAREDEERIEPLVLELEKRGWSVFWDQHIAAGEEWRDTIGKALRDARCVVVAWTRQSVEKFWVAEEAEFARKHGILLPVLLDQVEPPIGFQGIQTADLSDWSSGNDTPSSERFFRDVATLLQRGRADGSATAPPLAASLNPAKPNRGLARRTVLNRSTVLAMTLGLLVVSAGGFWAVQGRPPTLETAIQSLASARGTVRLEAIHDLGTLARASEANRIASLTALANLVREEAPYRPNVDRQHVEEDVQAALTLIGQLPKRAPSSDKPVPLALQNVDISGANLENANLEGVVLWGSNLRRVVLSRADLRGADLGGVDFTDASLEMADLRGALLWISDVADPKRPCILTRTRMAGTKLEGADLRGAILTDASGIDPSQLRLAKTNGSTALPRGMTLPSSQTEGSTRNPLRVSPILSAQANPRAPGGTVLRRTTTDRAKVNR